MKEYKVSFQVEEKVLAGENQTIEGLKTFLGEIEGVKNIEVEELFEGEGPGA